MWALRNKTYNIGAALILVIPREEEHPPFWGLYTCTQMYHEILLNYKNYIFVQLLPWLLLFKSCTDQCLGM